ncbi:DUF1963 domain-containing protein, partial [Streptomyces sp. MB09-02B]|nr:DUF1963 domain-containing protein [Streptomyces sp. MB09-02B]
MRGRCCAGKAANRCPDAGIGDFQPWSVAVAGLGAWCGCGYRATPGRGSRCRVLPSPTAGPAAPPGSPRGLRLDEEVEHRILLAQFGSDGDAKTTWGDEGTLYWLIRSEDLAAHRSTRPASPCRAKPPVPP